MGFTDKIILFTSPNCLIVTQIKIETKLTTYMLLYKIFPILKCTMQFQKSESANLQMLDQKSMYLTMNRFVPYSQELQPSTVYRIFPCLDDHI